jgi:hypothetical protein
MENPKKISRKIAMTFILLAIMLTLPSLELCFAQSSISRPVNQLLLVGPESYKSTVQRFIDFKESQGTPTLYTSTEDINKTLSSEDFVLELHNYIATQIKQFGLKYVILVGTYELVPTKYVYSPSSDLDVADFNYKPTDWYYGVPDWNNSQVGLLGGNIPLIPVGRFPVKNTQELDQMLSKIISVEESFCGGSFVALQDPNLSSDSGLSFAYSTVSLDVNFSPSSLARVLSENVSYVASYSHGTPGALWTQPANDQWIPILSSKDVSNLNSTFNIMYLVACFTGELDLQEEGLARALITSSMGPAFVIASSRTESLSNYIPSAFWEKFFETGNVGESFVFALQSYLLNSDVFSADLKAFQKYNFYLDKVLYGDVSWTINNNEVNSPDNVVSSTQSDIVLFNVEAGNQSEGSIGVTGFWVALPVIIILLSCVFAFKVSGSRLRNRSKVGNRYFPVAVDSSAKVGSSFSVEK